MPARSSTTFSSLLPAASFKLTLNYNLLILFNLKLTFMYKDFNMVDFFNLKLTL